MIDQIFPGTRVIAYDHITQNFINATVLRRYGYFSQFIATEVGNHNAGRYPDMCDLIFDNYQVSCCHFTDCLRLQS